MAVPLSWPQKRQNPLKAFAAYNGGFDVLDVDYVASVAWCGFFGVALGASVVVCTLFFFLAKAGLWLCNRHEVVVKPGRRHGVVDPRDRRVKITICVFVLVGVTGGAATLWVGGTLLRSAASGAMNSALRRMDGFLDDVLRLRNQLADLRSVLPEAGALADEAASATSMVASAARGVHSFSSKVELYARLASLSTTVIGAAFGAFGLLCLGATAASSRRGATAAAVLLWFVLIAAWFICGASWVFTVALKDACLSLDNLLLPESAVRLARLTRCTDDGGVAASKAWAWARLGADTVNAALYNFSIFTERTGLNHTQQMGYKCNPAQARPDGTFGAATISCPIQIATIDALNNTSVVQYHTVPAEAAFAQAYLQYRCPIDNMTACAAVGQMQLGIYERLAKADDTTRALVALLPTVERMTRCVDVRELLEEAQGTHCVRARVAVVLVFAGFLAACVSFVVLFFLILYGAGKFHPQDALCSLFGCCASKRQEGHAAPPAVPTKEAHPEEQQLQQEEEEEREEEEEEEEAAADEEEAVSPPRRDEEEAREQLRPVLTKPSPSRGAALARLAEEDEMREAPAVETNGAASAKSAVVVPVNGHGRPPVSSGWKSSGR